MNHPSSERRSFLAWAVTGLGAVFTAILGAPVIAYVIDPRHRKGSGGAFRVVDGIALDILRKDVPTQGVLRAVRRDGWTLHPNDVVGRVWVILKADRVPNRPVANDPHVLEVFTTICPHLGCSVNLNADPATGFTCPCHGAEFDVDGDRKAPQSNPAARNLDALEWKLEADPADPERAVLLVKYENFKSSISTKETI